MILSCFYLNFIFGAYNYQDDLQAAGLGNPASIFRTNLMNLYHHTNEGAWKALNIPSDLWPKWFGKIGLPCRYTIHGRQAHFEGRVEVDVGEDPAEIYIILTRKDENENEAPDFFRYDDNSELCTPAPTELIEQIKSPASRIEPHDILNSRSKDHKEIESSLLQIKKSADYGYAPAIHFLRIIYRPPYITSREGYLVQQSQIFESVEKCRRTILHNQEISIENINFSEYFKALKILEKSDLTNEEIKNLIDSSFKELSRNRLPEKGCIFKIAEAYNKIIPENLKYDDNLSYRRAATFGSTLLFTAAFYAQMPTWCSLPVCQSIGRGAPYLNSSMLAFLGLGWNLLGRDFVTLHVAGLKIRGRNESHAYERTAKFLSVYYALKNFSQAEVLKYMQKKRSQAKNFETIEGIVFQDIQGGA